MNTAIQQTSLFAYRELTHMGARQKAVYEIIAKNYPYGVTDKQIAEKLGWAINEVTPRRGECVKMGLVRKAGVVKQDGRSAIRWETGSIA